MARKPGQIIARGSRIWLVRVSLGRDQKTGTRRYHNKTVHGSLREAQSYLSKRLEEQEIGRLQPAITVRLDSFLDQWLVTVVKPRVRERTYRDYEGMLQRYIRPALGEKRLNAITQFDLQKIYSGMFEGGLSARTIQYTNAVLQSAFRQAVRWKMLIEDPCASVDLPRMKRKEMEALSVEECRSFLDAARESEFFAVFAVALTTGMRPSEYLALKWSDIDWKRGTASVCRSLQFFKGGWTFDDTKRKRSRRVVKLQGFVMDALSKLQKLTREGNWDGVKPDHDLIFRTSTGDPLKQQRVKAEFWRLLGMADIRKIRLYDLRHTAATLAVAAGVSVKVISDMLGHASITFTLERYSHVLPSIQDEAAARVERMLYGANTGDALDHAA
jgi:integrase